jgi:hypothetical protein
MIEKRSNAISHQSDGVTQPPAGWTPPAETIRPRRGTVLIAVVFVVALIAATEARPAVAQTRIMPLGDSITEAYTGYASYRYWLWHALADDGYQADFVGSMTGVYNGPPLYPDFDQDHEGHWGWRSDEVLAELSSWAAAAQPEVVLLHLGHNDLWQGQGVASTIVDLEAIVTALRTVNPDVTVVLAQVIPSTIAALSEIPALNTEIAVLAATLSTTQSPVIVVDQWTGFDAATDTYDGVHPNQTGEQKISAKWFGTLRWVLIPDGLVFRDDFESGATGSWSAGMP